MSEAALAHPIRAFRSDDAVGLYRVCLATGGDPEQWTPDQRLMHLLHHPDKAFPRTLPVAFGPYPSHLHIDLLPTAQGRGRGRALMERLLEALRRDGSAGVHLGVAAANARAIGFYEHLGFIPLGEGQEGRAVWMGKRLR